MDISLDVTAGGPTVSGAVLRSNQAYHELLCDKHTLDWGIAFINSRFGDNPLGNQFREVWIENESDAAAAIDAANECFAQADRNCYRWALAEAQNPDVIEPTLLAAGYVREDRLAMALTAYRDIKVNPDVRVLPARPMRTAYRAVFDEAWSIYPNSMRSDCVDACVERLDDHRMDMFVAMIDKQPAGVCGLFQVGDIGRIVDVYTCRSFRRKNVASTLLAEVISMARRLQMRIVCTDVSTANDAGRSLLGQLGFVEGGRLIEYHPPNVATIDYAAW